MFSLPGVVAKSEDTEEKLLRTEIERQLKIMRDNDPESAEYRNAFRNYTELHKEEISDRKLKESRRGRWFDGICTFVLAGVTLTADYWTPITSQWGRSLMGKFHHRETKL